MLEYQKLFPKLLKIEFQKSILMDAEEKKLTPRILCPPGSNKQNYCDSVKKWF